MSKHKKQQGFTLVEMIVSLGLFIIIMFIATSAFLSIVNTDRKARAVRIASDNLNITLEDMSRKIKTGSSYYCGSDSFLGGTNDCPGSLSNVFTFTDQDGIRTMYSLSPGFICGSEWGPFGCITRQRSPSALGVEPVTSPEIDIKQLGFLVSGSAPCGGTTPCTVSPPTSDAQQTKVVILVKGTVGKGAVATSFNIQTTVTQRAYDN